MNKKSWKISEPTDMQLLRMKQNVIRKKKRRRNIMISTMCVLFCLGGFVFVNKAGTKNEVIIKDNKVSKESIILNYEKMEIEELPSKFGSQTSYCVESFRLDMLKDVVLSVKGEVIDSKIANNYQVIQMKISDIFYRENKVRGNEVIEIWLPLHSYTSLNDLIHPFYEKGIYYVNLKIINNHYELVYPYDERIEETKNGIVLFPKTWKELKNEKTYIVEDDERWARWDEEFNEDYKNLIMKYKGE